MNIPNQLTILRILLVPALIISIIYYSPEKEYLRLVAFSIFVFGCITDAVDGYIARKFNQKTKLGTLLDPLADKLIVLSAFISIYLNFDLDLI